MDTKSCGNKTFLRRILNLTAEVGCNICHNKEMAASSCVAKCPVTSYFVLGSRSFRYKMHRGNELATNVCKTEFSVTPFLYPSAAELGYKTHPNKKLGAKTGVPCQDSEVSDPHRLSDNPS